MQTMIGVRFKKAGKVYDFGQGRLEIEKGDHIGQRISVVRE